MPERAQEVEDAIEVLRADPTSTAIFTDLDGTLSEIVERPADAEIDQRGREALARIESRYALAAIVTGRRCADARRIAGIDRLLYIGNHGSEVLEPEEAEAHPAPALAGEEDRARSFADSLDWERLRDAGISLEDKGTIAALHWRGSADERRAERLVVEIEDAAASAGLGTHRGRKVLELRPPVEIDKGRGIAAALDEHPEIRTAFYAGDDRTDVDGFRRLEELEREGRLERAVTVAVISAETPDQVPKAARLSVEGIATYVDLLERLT